MFEFSENKVTGSPECNFIGKLVSVAKEPKNNGNGTPYRACSVEFKNADEKVVQRGGLIYEKNYSYGMQVGNEYLCTARITDQGVLITVSHLQSAARASVDDFGFDGVLQSINPLVEVEKQ